jgi:hypothetical protein
MTVNTDVRSLKSMCLGLIVTDHNKRRESVEKIREQIPETLFSQLKHLQEKTVNLTVANWNNHNFCLGTIENFSIHKPLSEILEFISKKTSPYGFVWKTVYIDDLDWNRRQPNCPMWKTASKEKTLSEYGFKPAENVRVLLDRI